MVVPGQLSCSSANNVCTTSDCVTAAARLLQNMDKSINPCDNFYQYACGGWLERHVIPETSSRHSVFDILRDKLEIVLKGVLETAREQDRDAIKKAKVLYGSCINESEPLLKLIDSIGGWPVASEDWNATAGWKIFSLTLSVSYTNWHPCSVPLRTHIDQPGLGMPSRDYYFNDGNFKKVREAYLQFMVSIAKITREDRNLTQDDDKVWEEMMQVLELETDIANATSPAEERQDVTVLYSKMTLGELQSTFSFNDFNWTRFIRGVMSSVSIDVQLEEEVVVYSTPYLEKMNDVLSRHSLIIDRVNSLSRRFKDARARYRKALYGTTVEDAWWRDCVRYVQSSMENAVGALYVSETFAGESKRMVSDLIGKIQKAFVETLEELSWMDASSKEKAREKVTKPETLGRWVFRYFKNIFTVIIFLLFRQWQSRSNNPVFLTLHVNAESLLVPFLLNLVLTTSFFPPVFPAGILQPPFFSKHQQQALNFGGIGMVIGHEITHGFDDNGRNFDKDGNMLNWWSNYSAEHFKEQSQCMVQQYGDFVWKLAGGQNVSGISTLGENIADNGGVRQAYKAYLQWVDMEGEELQLPGLDMDHKQLFFLNFAQVWCGAYRPEYASQSIKTDSHSPLEYRVLGSLQNFEAFSEAFQCPKGSLMNPEQKCRVW
uniref:Membrane metalloendopeptidase like 1 n=1 Tax=Nothobranchius furzeri TaxID=105023 RepID=A0A8C6PFZ0_NOTFU